ncbi:MAG: ParA family protein [Anaerolineae bacterium]|nr:MAG: ParA family protein [Anaerolineae bacterium]
MTRILAIASEKGGVAKTTTAVSLGGALVKQGQDVLLVDLDPQASLTLAMGIPPHSVRRSLADVLLNSATPVSVSRETAIPGLDILPASSELILAERFLPIRRAYKQLLRQALAKMPLYDTIILDCPPSLGVLTHLAMVACQMLIIPTTPEYLSIYALRNMLRDIQTVREQENPGLNYRLLITMLDLRVRSHATLSQQLRATFGEAVLQTVIQVDTRLRDSAVAGLPITHFAASARSAKQYTALAQEILQYVRTESVTQTA